MPNAPRSERLPEDQRPPMVFQPRDLEILKAISDCRALTAQHIEDLFERKQSTIQRRLQLLYQHEYLDRQYLAVVSRAPASLPAIYTVGARGVRALIDGYQMDRGDIRRPRTQLGWKFLDHLLHVNDVRVSIILATRQHGLEVIRWLDEPYFRAHKDYTMVPTAGGKQRKYPVLPDGYFLLGNVPQGATGRAHFFLEIDRGTEPLDKFTPQIVAYDEYVRSDAYERRFSAKSLRILIVTTTDKRLANLQAATRRVSSASYYWFTTFDRVTCETVLTRPIWYNLTEPQPYPLVDL